MEKLGKKLRSEGYKATKARLLILETFSKSKTPLDTALVYRKIKKYSPKNKINEATVFRTISSFEKSGLLRKVDLRRDSAYFELMDEHHHHIVCTNCEKTEDFKNSKIEKLLKRIVENSLQIKNNFKSISEHSLELFGLCKVCAKG